MKRFILLVACIACIDWTRLKGTVKSVNLKDSKVTIQNDAGDLLTIPVDYQVKVMEKRGEMRALKDLQLDEKIILIKTVADQPKDDTEGLVPLESSQRGH